MSVGDLYREFELYLEKAQHDITQVFENGFKTAEKNEEEIVREEKCKDPPDWDVVDGYNFQLKNKFEKLIMPYNVNPKDDLVKPHSYIPIKKSSYQYSPKTDQSFYKINGDNFDIQTDNNFNTCNEFVSPVISQPSPSQSCTSLTSFSSPWAESPSPCISVPDQDISDDSISFMSADALEDRAHNKTRFWNLELAVKSSSAPTLERDITSVNSQPRSQSDRHLSEVEAIESCKWLRLAGFPQYAQMYEENQFPIDLHSVEKDHPMLDLSGLNSLFRRLQALNNFAHLHQQQRVTHDDSEEEQCALSNKWIYEAKLRRWSRIEQNVDIPSTLEARKHEFGEDVIPETSGLSTKDTRRRFGSINNKRRIRDGIVLTDSNPAVLEILSEQLHAISATNSAPDSPNLKIASNPFSYRNKSRSLEKNDLRTSYSPGLIERVAWRRLGANAEETVESRLVVEEDGSRSIYTLSCTQLQVLRKIALLNLTENFEKYCPTHKSGWNWYFPKLIRKKKTPSYKGKNVFGVPLSVILQRTGCSLPKGITDALQYLEQYCYDQDGIFRTCGVKSRIVQLKEKIEAEDETVNFSEVQANVIVGMIKQYFKDLPECLFTAKLSETFTMIFQFLPEEERPHAIVCALLLMPDDHREVLFILLDFLHKITSHSDTNLMDNKNMGICFAGSLFYFDPSKIVLPKTTALEEGGEIKEIKAANECLRYMLDNFVRISKIPKELSKLCSCKETVPVPLSGLKTDSGNWKTFLEQCQNMLLKEVFEKGWVSEQTYHPKIELAYKEVADGYPLHLWKVTAEIEAPPTEVLHRIMRERPKWDDELHSSRIIAEIDENVEIIQYACKGLDPLPIRDYCVVRLWKHLPKNACSIIETSIEHPDVINIPNSTRGIVLACRYYIEPCGSGKSRLVNLSRVDTRGRTPEWYRKNYGHLCAFLMAKIQHSFKLPMSGILESNV